MLLGKASTILKRVTMDNMTKSPEEYNVTTIEYLDIFQCGFIDFPESGIDCSQNLPNFCLKCELRGGYLTGESINDKSTGHLICRIVWVICLFVGSLGVLTNIWIILILQTRHSNRSFDLLLTFLSYVDLFCCLSSLSASTASVAYFDNWFGRSQLIIYWIYLSSLIVLLFRFTSVYLTTLVTLERYLVIAYPLQSRIWFSRTRAKLHVLLTVIFVILTCMPRYTSLYIGENIYSSKEGHLNVSSLADYDYIFRPTRLYPFWFRTLGGLHDFWLHFFEFWMPIPILLLFNIWSYRKMQNLRRQRVYLNSTQRKEFQVARMFVPVVVILLFCNIWPLLGLVLIYIRGIYFREMWMMTLLTFQVNSAANFFIYYYRGTIFRAETNVVFLKCLNKLPGGKCKQAGGGGVGG